MIVRPNLGPLPHPAVKNPSTSIQNQSQPQTHTKDQQKKTGHHTHTHKQRNTQRKRFPRKKKQKRHATHLLERISFSRCSRPRHLPQAEPRGRCCRATKHMAMGRSPNRTPSEHPIQSPLTLVLKRVLNSPTNQNARITKTVLTATAIFLE